MRNKRFTKTIAFRVSDAEYELLEWISAYSGHKSVGATIRELMWEQIPAWNIKRTSEIKKLEAAAKRTAKAANNDAV